MVKYQFEIEDDKWLEWKNTVPRSKSLEQRIIELIEADTQGRVQQTPGPSRCSGSDPKGEAGESAPADPRSERGDGHTVRQEAEHSLRELGVPGSGENQESRIEALLEMHDLLREHEGVKIGTSQLKEIAAEFDHGYKDADSFWTNCVKKNKTQGRENALKSLPGVREAGSGKYTYNSDE
jgi:hypothetical protein